MRIRKVINRVYEGTVYYRWLLSVPPKKVRELGWVDGQEVSAMVRGSTLWIEASSRPRPRPGKHSSGALEDGIQRKSLLTR